MAGSMIRSGADWGEALEAVYRPGDSDVEWGERLTDLAERIFHASFIGILGLRHDARCTKVEIDFTSGRPEVLREIHAAVDFFGPRALPEIFYPSPIVTTHLEATSRLARRGQHFMGAMRERLDCADAIGLVTHPAPDVVLCFSIPQDRPITLARRERRLLTQFALHVEASYRLLRRPEVVRAVLSADGKVLHREKGAIPGPTLSAQVIRLERARSRRPAEAGDVLDPWSVLVGGRASLVPRAEGARRYYLLVDNAPASQPLRALTRGELDAVSLASRGLSAKLVGYALGVSEPTVSSRLASAASKIGLASRVELVRVAALLTRDPRAGADDVALTRAERDILDLLVRGLSNREIAALRQRSVRTIANQVAMLLRKANAPSRRALVARWPSAHRADASRAERRAGS